MRKFTNQTPLKHPDPVLSSMSGFHYRWTGNENDDDGNFKIPTEAFERLEVDDLHPVDNDPLILTPKDKNFFVWQKQASEFKACKEMDITQIQSHPKGKRMTDKKEIEAYMRRCVSPACVGFSWVSLFRENEWNRSR